MWFGFITKPPWKIPSVDIRRQFVAAERMKLSRVHSILRNRHHYGRTLFWRRMIIGAEIMVFCCLVVFFVSPAPSALCRFMCPPPPPLLSLVPGYSPRGTGGRGIGATWWLCVPSCRGLHSRAVLCRPRLPRSRRSRSPMLSGRSPPFYLFHDFRAGPAIRSALPPKPSLTLLR